MWIAHALGWGLPALFLAISLPITGLSYRLGTTCIPNPKAAFITWFGWLIAFACLAAALQFVTTGFCLVVYIKNLIAHHNNSPANSDTSGSGSSGAAITSPDPSRPVAPSVRLGKRLAWRRVRKVMLLQWRSIVLSLLVIVEIVYFGSVYAAQQKEAKADEQPKHTAQTEAWGLCLIESGGNKKQCLPQAQALSLGENWVIASLFMSAVSAPITTACYRAQSLLTWVLR